MQIPFSRWPGLSAFDVEGCTFGTVTEVYVDPETGESQWLEVVSAESGRSVVVPSHDATVEGRGPAGVQLPYSAETMLRSPDVMANGGLTRSAEGELARHYQGAGRRSRSRRERGDGAAPRTGSTGDDRGPLAHDDEAEVVRHEEQLQVATEVHETGTVRLRKWVESETVTQEVLLHHEHLRVEREPVNIANVDGALAHAEIGEVEIEVVLRDEQVVASKITVPQEIVRLTKEVVVEPVVVETELRRERVDLEHDGALEATRDDGSPLEHA